MSDDLVREAEELILGGIMTDPAVVPDVIEILGTDKKVFFTVQHQLIYEAALNSYNDNDGRIDPVLVLEKLEVAKQDNRAGGPEYLYDIYSKIAETENTSHYARIVKESAIRRQTIAKSERIRTAATDTTIPQQQLDDMIAEEASAVQRRRNEHGETVITDTVPFPESVMTGVFDEYWHAYFGCTEVSKSFLFGTLKTAIGASLGRRVSLAGTTPLYPNFFTCCVGHTALARKSTALSLAESVLDTADQGVFTLRSAATPEGLLAALSLPDKDEDEEEGGGESKLYGNADKIEMMRDEIIDGTEGVRMMLSIDEFSHLLKKAGKTHGDGLIQMLATAYNMPLKLQHPTRVDPLVADSPCLSMMGATTIHWLESSLKLEDIQGGFANRITYYLGSESADWIFEDKPGDPKLLTRVAREINALRLKYAEPTQFRFDPETAVAGQGWYEKHRSELSQESNPLIIMASARTDVHVKKLALLFSAIENAEDDHEIHIEAFTKALVLANYLQKVVSHLYSNFNFSDEKRLETKILELLAKKPGQTARELKQKVMWASSKQVNEACDELSKDGSISRNELGKRIEFSIMPEWA